MQTTEIQVEMVPIAGIPSTHTFSTYQEMVDFLKGIEGIACKLNCFAVKSENQTEKVPVHLGNALALLSRKKAP